VDRPAALHPRDSDGQSSLPLRDAYAASLMSMIDIPCGYRHVSSYDYLARCVCVCPLPCKLSLGPFEPGVSAWSVCCFFHMGCLVLARPLSCMLFPLLCLFFLDLHLCISSYPARCRMGIGCMLCFVERNALSALLGICCHLGSLLGVHLSRT